MENASNLNTKHLLIGITGFIGCGKDTAANYLVNNYNFRRESFAGTLKDAVSAVFGWDREMLEGQTAQSREAREQVDTWWANRLNIPNLTPRWVLQHWGTEVLRHGFHNDIWIASIENKLRNATSNIVISDCRFPNEMQAIKNLGGYLVWVQRGELPDWYDHAIIVNTGQQHRAYQSSLDFLLKHKIHASETSWVGSNFDYIVNNNLNLDHTYGQLNQIISKISLNC